MELIAVVAIIGLISGMAALRWGDYATRTTAAQGFVRSLNLTLGLARRQAIAEGTPAAVVLTRQSGAVTSFALVRAEGGGDVPTDAAIVVPAGVTVTTSYDRWEFNYSGALITPVGGGAIGVGDGDWNWDLTVNAVTGHVATAKAK